MSAGRTLWYSEDSAFVQRGRIVALGEEFGAVVLAVMMVLRGEAKQQNDSGWVLSALSTVARNSFSGDRVLVRRVIERAGEMGELDELEWKDDGLRFTCRISGWKDDQDKAATARRVAKHRARSNGAVTVGNEDRTGQDNNDSLRSSSHRNDHDGHDIGTAAPDRSAHRPEPETAPLDATADQAPLCHLLADLIASNGSRRPRIGRKWVDAERLLLERDGRDRSEAEQLVRWCQADEFWRSNIMSMATFREKYDRLRLQAQRSNGAGGGAAGRESASDLLRAMDGAAAARRGSPPTLLAVEGGAA